MGKKELGFDKDGIRLTMKGTDFWAYGLGVLGISVISNLVGQLGFFYTDKVGMAAEIAGSAIMIAKVADAFSDLVMGAIVDRTNTKYGKARPWLLWTAPFMLISVMALLLISPNWSNTAQFVYAIITNIFASAIVCTAISVPYACLLNYRTASQYERTKMNIRRTICNYLLGMFFAVGLIPLTKAMGGTQKSWIVVGLILSIVATGGMTLCFAKTKEQNNNLEAKAEKASNFFSQIISLFKNKYWIIMALAQIVSNIIFGFNSATNVYYAKWIFGDESIVGIMGIIAVIPTFLGFVIVSPLVKRFGALNVVKAALFIGIIGYGVRAVFPYNFLVVCISGSLTALATMPFMMTAMVMVADVSDFEEWKTGEKKVGLVQTATSFGAKVGGGFAAGIIGWVLALGGYKSAAAAQFVSAINSIFAICIYIPMALLILLFILMCMFNLDKTYPHFKNDLLERHN